MLSLKARAAAKTCLLVFVLSISALAQGKNPVVLVPGLWGSELRHKITNERVWFKTVRSKSEDLRLPITADPTKSRDDLMATDVLREVKIGPFPVTDVYDSFIKAMESRGGYHEESWNEPSEDGYEDSLYVFPYDWRLDNVENARSLVRKVEELKIKLKRPNLKFDIVAHSLGGLISRYAAMYGDVDLPSGNRKPTLTWAGSKHFGKIILMGTPNEGSPLTISAMTEGFTVGGLRVDLPFMEDTSRFTSFTIPSGYQLLPAPGTLRVFNEQLEPIDVDVYDPKVWTKYGWNAINDPHFASEFTAAERKAAPQFFAAALARARKFHEALAAANGRSDGIEFYLIGADCRTALDALVVIRDEKNDKWRTLFRPKGFTRKDGSKVTEDELKALMLTDGDGVVSDSSLRAKRQSTRLKINDVVGFKGEKIVCEAHNKLAANSKVQDQVISILDNGAAQKKVEQEDQ